MRFSFLTLLLLTGCSESFNDKELTADLACETAKMVVKQRMNPSPTPDDNSETCSNCNGSGKVGDGRVFVKCPVCDGTGKKKK